MLKVQTKIATLYRGDCLEILPTLPPESVDFICADPPYGQTRCKWDSPIPFAPMWRELKRVIRPGGGTALFCSQPFTSVLITSNLKEFKYCWTWDKMRGKGHLVVRYRPMQQTEDIAIFGKGAIRYYPIMRPREKKRFQVEGSRRTEIMGGKPNPDYKGKVATHRHPTTIIRRSWSPVKGHHPTEKPVDLVEYLIKTYTRKGDTVLDFTMGSGTTGVACARTGRVFIGIEKEGNYFEVARQRIEDAEHG